MGILLTDGRKAEPYTYKPYPKFLEHRDGQCCVVNTIEQHRALGEGWPRPEGEDEPVPVAPVPDAAFAPTEFGAVAVDVPKPRKRKADAKR